MSRWLRPRSIGKFASGEMAQLIVGQGGQREHRLQFLLLPPTREALGEGAAHC